MTKKVILTLTLFLFAFCAQSQTISKNEKKEVCLKIAELIKFNYVIKEKGDQIAAAFIKEFKAGRFDFADNWKQLDSVISKSLNDISNDGHLYTSNNPEIVKQLKEEKKGKKQKSEPEVKSFFNDQEAYNNNFGFKKIEIIEGNIGYLELSQINISPESLNTLCATMDFVKNTQALLIDLRGNSGGGSTVGAVLETFFFEKDIELLEFKNRNGNTEMAKTVPWLLEERYTKPLYILINSKTASAAEAFAFALKHQARAIIVGEPSAGGAFMNKYFLVNDQLVLAVSNNAPFLPGTQFTWQGTGVKPDVSVDQREAKEKALELIYKELRNE